MNRIIGSANAPAGTDRKRCQLIKRTLHIEPICNNRLTKKRYFDRLTLTEGPLR